MPWCPKCGAEFREGFKTCNTCHVPLVSHEPDGSEQLPEMDEPKEKWLRRDSAREHLLRILRALIVFLLALAAVTLLAHYQ